MPDAKRPWAKSNKMMLDLGFSQERLRRALIWAARYRECPRCHASPWTPCRNLTGIKNLGFDQARENKYPHAERINYDALERTLVNWRWQ